jgi:hypothetical protein
MRIGESIEGALKMLKRRFVSVILLVIVAITALMVLATGGKRTSTENDDKAHHESQKLTIADGSTDAHFGAAIAVSGGTAIIGAPLDGREQWATGAAYVCCQLEGTWTLTQKLPCSATVGANFGASVALSGGTAIIGAPADGQSGASTGMAYIFERDGDKAWRQIAGLTASDATVNSDFGHSVAISGDLAIVGARRSNREFGAAYVFQHNGNGHWSETAKLTADDQEVFAYFGGAVALDGETAFIGAYGDSTAGPRSGAVYIFQRDPSATWRQVAKLVPNDAKPFSWFGWALALDGDTAVIGAYADSSAAQFGGAAYVYRCDMTGTWRHIAKLAARDAIEGERFGFSVAIGGGRIVIGSPLRNNCAGAAHLFGIDNNGRWKQLGTFNASDPHEQDGFGRAVGVSGKQWLVGAHQDDNASPNTGSAYVFDMERAL